MAAIQPVWANGCYSTSLVQPSAVLDETVLKQCDVTLSVMLLPIAAVCVDLGARAGVLNGNGLRLRLH